MNPSFQDLFFAAADPDEMRSRDPAMLKLMAESHLALLNASAANEVRVQLLAQPTDQKQDAGTSMVQIVHPDMPFLVDSVTMAVNGSGRTVHWIVHPLLRVTRNAAGKVARIAGAVDHTPGEGQMVSCILVECDRLASDPDGEALCQKIEDTLRDVRCAVQDWRAMLSRVQVLNASFTAVDAPEADEAKAFLTWLEQGHFTFLAAEDYELKGKQLVPVPGTALGLLKNAGEQALPSQPAQQFSANPVLVLSTKAMRRSTVHRPAWLDAISVKRMDAAGRLVGESRFFGLYTAAAYGRGERQPRAQGHAGHS